MRTVELVKGVVTRSSQNGPVLELELNYASTAPYALGGTPVKNVEHLLKTRYFGLTSITEMEKLIMYNRHKILGLKDRQGL